MTITEEARQVEQMHPGWHLWFTDQGKPMATRAGGSAFGGSGVTLELPHMARAEQILAAWDFAVAHQFDPLAAVADAAVTARSAAVA